MLGFSSAAGIAKSLMTEKPHSEYETLSRSCVPSGMKGTRAPDGNSAGWMESLGIVRLQELSVWPSCRPVLFYFDSNLWVFQQLLNANNENAAQQNEHMVK